jgi:integrase
MAYETEIMKNDLDYFTEEEIKKLFDAMPNERDRLLFLTMLLTGRRIGEVVGNPKRDTADFKTGLFASDINVQDNLISFCILKKRRKTKDGVLEPYNIKKSKEAPSFLIARLNAWAADHPKLFDLSRQHAGYLLKMAAKRAGVTRPNRFKRSTNGGIHCQMFRHTFSIRWLRNDASGASLTRLYRHLEHSSINQTMSYLRFAETENKEVMSKMAEMFEARA